MLEELEGNDNIIKVKDIFYNKQHQKVYIVMEYNGDGIDLGSFIKQ